jgi:hypothetical protein
MAQTSMKTLLLGVAGVSLLGSAIGSFVSTTIANDVWTMGFPDFHGENPEWNRKAKTAAPYGSDFKSDYYAVAYMKFETVQNTPPNQNAPPKLTVQHAYFQTNPLTGAAPEADALECAVDILKMHGKPAPNPAPTPPSWANTCKIVTPKPPPDRPWECDQGQVYKNFNCFYFGKPIRIFVIVDNDNINFNTKVPVSITPFASDADLGEKQNTSTKKPLDQNFSFYNAHVLDSQTAGRNVLYIENHYTDEEGNPIADNSWREYSINFNLEMCDGGVCIPLVIDPGTGNGLGYPP